MSWRALRVALVCGTGAAVALPACGGNSSNDTSTPSAGSGGVSGAAHGGSAGKGASTSTDGPKPLVCGKAMCKAIVIPQAQNFEIPACCADEAKGTCGLDSSVLAMFGPTFAEACQPLAQPGVKDATCPNSAATPVSGTALTIKFPGCCRPNGQCGYQLDSIGGVIQIGLGCVDSAPFLDGGTPTSCGGNSGGAAGEGGMGGAGPSMSAGEGGVAGMSTP